MVNTRTKKFFKLIGIDILKLICFLILCSVIGSVMGLCMALILSTFFEFPYYGWTAYGIAIVITFLYHYLKNKWELTDKE